MGRLLHFLQLLELNRQFLAQALIAVRRLVAEESMDERALTQTDGAEVFMRLTQKRCSVPKTFIGKGKTEDLFSGKNTNTDVVIFDDELLPSQLNLI